MKPILFFLAVLPLALRAQTCTPSFTYSVNGNTVTFTNTSDPVSTEDEGTRWDFGDGSPHDVSGINPIIHVYSSPGTYLVCLGTYDSACLDSMYTCQTVVIGGDTTCSASFTFNVSGNQVTFTNTSNPISGEPEGVRWDFGDGSPHDVSGINPITHTYSGTGTYVVCMGTFDSACPDSMWNCQTVIIEDTGCYASFTYTQNNNQLIFTNNSNPVSTEFEGVRWDFGDGSPHDVSGVNPIMHTYTSTGVYYVCMGTFDSSCPDSMYACGYIYVPTIGVEEMGIASKIFVFPNPASDFVRVSAEGYLINLIEIIEASGRLVCTSKMPELDVAALNAGFYTMKIHFEEGMIIQKKFLKE